MEVDHYNLAEETYRECGEPKTIQGVFDYTLKLIAKLPPEEEAGLVSAPANGENVVIYNGIPVRCNRVCYPDGQLYKVQTDTPNGNAAWNDDGTVDPSKYVTVTDVPDDNTDDNEDVMNKLNDIEVQLDKMEIKLSNVEMDVNSLIALFRKFSIYTAQGWLSVNPGKVIHDDKGNPIGYELVLQTRFESPTQPASYETMGLVGKD